jgi:hypothetical protein
MPGKKGSGLCLSEKELPERRSGAFRHKNTLANIHSFSGIQTHGLSVQAIKAYTSERAVNGTGPFLHNVPKVTYAFNVVVVVVQSKHYLPDVSF